MDPQIPRLSDLTDADVHALRLGAQVMGHKAELDGRERVAGYFDRLEAALRAEISARADIALRPDVAGRRYVRAISGTPELWADLQADAEDRRLVAEYLDLLIANERLSAALRELCRALRARDSR